MKLLTLAVIVIACSYIGYRLYTDMEQAIMSKKIHEKNQQDFFWESQQSFEE